MTVTPATREAILYVLSYLWPRGEEELAKLGLSKAEAYYRFADYANHGRNQALIFDGVPAAVVGIATEGHESFTWFQATNEFEKYASQITRHIRREAAAHKGPLYIYSVCVHPNTERWFRVLGFMPDNHSQTLPTGAELLRFKRK